MRNSDLYAVVTGDIVGFSQIEAGQRSNLVSVLKSSLEGIKSILSGEIRAPFEMHRGDSFQGVLSRPGDALRVVIHIRAGLRCGFRTDLKGYSLDARIVAGIGTIDFLPSGRASEGDGEAFRRSGPILDKMKKRQLLIRTPWEEINAELDVECALLDALVNRWTADQAEAILGQIRGLTQKHIAEELGISQPAVQQRLEGAGGWAIGELGRRYERLIREGISREAYNEV